jgi:23S rRNA (cytosine1962-C5)-methyltransferase
MDIYLPTVFDREDKHSSDLKNRIRKNYNHIKKWAKRTQTNCFRIYDHEVPGYPLAIDYYDGRFLIHFFSRDKDAPDLPANLQQEIETTLRSLFNADPSSLYFRTRIKRDKLEQYEKLNNKEDFFIVQEYGHSFFVNLTDYLDTGLFLDHKETRRLVSLHAKGKSLLNLFAYTGSFTVYAARAGASFTKTVDLSNTYTTWAEKNFLLNNMPLSSHSIIREDCLKFLEHEVKTNHRYDLIVIDPPTVSRSKKMTDFFDVQKDYIFLIEKALHLLNPKGIIFFSTNLRSFSFDISCFPHCLVEDISKKTLPLDFHNKKIHKCFKITHKHL